MQIFNNQFVTRLKRKNKIEIPEEEKVYWKRRIKSAYCVSIARFVRALNKQYRNVFSNYATGWPSNPINYCGLGASGHHHRPYIPRYTKQFQTISKRAGMAISVRNDSMRHATVQNIFIAQRMCLCVVRSHKVNDEIRAKDPKLEFNWKHR